ncbi:MAG: HD domain-containing protein, partial [Candidatus Asgardarchaeia archaeon]
PDLTVITFKIFANDTFGNEAYSKEYSYTVVDTGASHTRFEHSLGVMNVAGMVVSRLNATSKDHKIDKVESIRAAALLHDIGHGPFSHAFENVMLIANDWNEDITHETITLEIIKNDVKIASFLEGDGFSDKSFDNIHKDVIKLLGDRNLQSVERDIISGPLDADKLDYLRRDSYHCGVAYGIFDFHRVIHTLSTVHYPKYSRLVVLEKGKDSLESFRLARYLMHTQVYQHHVRAITDAMLVKAAEYAFKENVIHKEDLRYSRNDIEFLSYYISLTDEIFLFTIYKKSKGVAREIVKNFYERKLLKRGFERNWQSLSYNIRAAFSKLLEAPAKERFQKIRELEAEIAKVVNTKEYNIIVYPRIIEIPLYKSPDIYSEGEEKKILIKMRDGDIKPLDEVSPLTTAQFKVDAKLFVFCPPNKVDAVKDKSKKIIERVLS